MIDGYGSGQGAGELGVIEDSQVSLGGEDVNAAGQGAAALDQEPDRAGGSGDVAVLQGDGQAGSG